MRYRAMSLLLTGCLLAPLSAEADIVFLDFDDFDVRMSELSANAGIDNFSAAELTQLQDGITAGVSSIFNDFDGLSFTQTDPGGTRSVINFGLSGGGLGVADHIDFLNQVVNDTARVFSAQFGFIVDEFSGSTDRAEQISQLTAALTGTAAHELGHNLGLRHHDAFSDVEYDGSGSVAAGGSQNTHVMATGSTGLGELGRETFRDFSVNSLVKLAYAEGTLADNPEALFEAGDAGDTLGTATFVDFEAIPVANQFGEVIIGQIDSSSDVDFFEVRLEAGSVFTVDVNNDYASGIPNEFLDTILALFDSNGVQIGINDDTFYSSTQFGDGTRRDTDSLLYNVSIAETGSYFVRLTPFGSDSGDYQLLMHTNMMSAVPEPSSLAMLALIGGLGLGHRRRRRSTNNCCL